jgi:hypothetical protein
LDVLKIGWNGGIADVPAVVGFSKIMDVIFPLVGCSPLINGVGNGWNGGVTAVPAVDGFSWKQDFGFWPEWGCSPPIFYQIVNMGSVDGLGWNGVMTPPLFLGFYVDAVGGFWLEWGYFTPPNSCKIVCQIV